MLHVDTYLVFDGMYVDLGLAEIAREKDGSGQLYNLLKAFRLTARGILPCADEKVLATTVGMRACSTVLVSMRFVVCLLIDDVHKL